MLQILTWLPRPNAHTPADTNEVMIGLALRTRMSNQVKPHQSDILQIY